MKDLEEAWTWYSTTRTQLQRMRRLATRYWEELPWKGRMGGDPAFHHEGAEVIDEVDLSLAHLDDLAVRVLFSVFETLVRGRVLVDVRREAETIRHVALQQ